MSGCDSHGVANVQGASPEEPMGVVPYRPSSEEGTPLLPGRTKRKISLTGCNLIMYGFLALAVAAFFIGNLGLHFMRCPLYPSTMDAIRRGWEKEVMDHRLLQDKWRLEEQDHTAIREEWQLEKEWHDRDVVRRIQEENERQERVRWEWAQEYKRHVRELEEYEEAVAQRVHEEQNRQERVRQEWEHEEQEHKQEVAHRIHEEEERQENVRKMWALELEEHRHQCEEMERHEHERQENQRQRWRHEIEDHDQMVEERQRHEEEERQKLNMYWGQVEAHTCTTYATRDYTARLMNLPVTWEHRVEACKATPLEVHGISHLPKDCEDKGAGVVIGRWEVNQHEPDCASFWNWYKDKGCTSPGSGKRRIEHYLENLPKGGDWREFCATTPVRFNGLEFSGAQECFQHNWGTYGHWEIADTNCA